MGQANDHYILLEQKIENAIQLRSFIIFEDAGHPLTPYFTERDRLLKVYHDGRATDAMKKVILDEFERINSTIKTVMGL